MQIIQKVRDASKDIQVVREDLAKKQGTARAHGKTEEDKALEAQLKPYRAFAEALKNNPTNAWIGSDLQKVLERRAAKAKEQERAPVAGMSLNSVIEQNIEQVLKTGKAEEMGVLSKDEQILKTVGKGAINAPMIFAEQAALEKNPPIDKAGQDKKAALDRFAQYAHGVTTREFHNGINSGALRPMQGEVLENGRTGYPAGSKDRIEIGTNEKGEVGLYVEADSKFTGIVPVPTKGPNGQPDYNKLDYVNIVDGKVDSVVLAPGAKHNIAGLENLVEQAAKTAEAAMQQQVAQPALQQPVQFRAPPSLEVARLDTSAPWEAPLAPEPGKKEKGSKLVEGLKKMKLEKARFPKATGRPGLAPPPSSGKKQKVIEGPESLTEPAKTRGQQEMDALFDATPMPAKPTSTEVGAPEPVTQQKVKSQKEMRKEREKRAKAVFGLNTSRLPNGRTTEVRGHITPTASPSVKSGNGNRSH